eukprot:366130-Chlamydomonas_euryale.AAC.2
MADATDEWAGMRLAITSSHVQLFALPDWGSPSGTRHLCDGITDATILVCTGCTADAMAPMLLLLLLRRSRPSLPLAKGLWPWTRRCSSSSSHRRPSRMSS